MDDNYKVAVVFITLFVGIPLAYYLIYRFFRYGPIDMWLPRAKERKKIRKAREKEIIMAELNRRKENSNQKLQPLREAARKDISRYQLPEKPQLIQDQPWRAPTGIRHLEKLKQQLISLEKGLIQGYDEMVKLREESQHRAPGLLATAGFMLKDVAIKTLPGEIEELTNRIENIYKGNVRPEIIELETEIQKLELNTPQDHFTKTALIELRAGIKELQSLSTFSASTNQKKMADYLERRRLDHQHRIEEKIGGKLTTQEEVIKFNKRRRQEIINNGNFSEKEQNDLLDALDRECEQYLRGTKSNISIYEDD